MLNLFKKNTCFISRKPCPESGYSLISVAISMIILGLVFAAGLTAYGTYMEKQRIEITENNVREAISEIETFREVKGRYPCPSSLTATRNLSTYGQENESDCINAGPAIPAGSCVDGVCVVNSEASRIGIAPTVRIGALPFRALQMDEKKTYDAYGSRLLYAVTERQAVESTFSETSGGIDIIDENGNSVLSPIGSGNFVVLSHGSNKVGAFTNGGAQSIACPTLGTSLEANNCVDLASPPPNAIFRSSFVALAGGATEFDDTIDYFSTVFDPTWKRISSSPNDIQALTTNNLGAGISSPSETIEIGQNVNTPAGNGVGRTWDGGLRVSNDTTGTSLQANKFCQQNGADCFDIEDFSGSTGIECTNPGEYMIGIEGNGSNATAKCAPVMVQCPTGQVFRGVNATTGAPLCSVAYTNCNAENVQICNTSGNFDPKHSNQAQTNAIPILSGVHNEDRNLTDTTPYTFAANPKVAKFRCDGGIWKYYSDVGGFCGNNCIPPSWAGPAPYTGTNTSLPSTVACTGAMSGYETTTSITTCSFAIATCSTNCAAAVAPCNCAAYFPVDVNGEPTTGTSGNPPPPKPGDILGTCPTGYNSGGKTTTHVWDKTDAVCNWKLGPTANTCSCDATLAGTAPNTDPGKDCNDLIVGTSGHADAVWAFDSTAGQCKWKVTGYDTSSCSCDTTTEHISGTPHAPTCNTACDTESTPAVWAYKYKLDAGVCVKDTEYIKTPAVCGNKSFSWTAITYVDSSASLPSGIKQCGTSCRTSSVSSPVTTPPYAVVGSSACPELGSTDSCWKAEGVYKTYNAKCQAN
ncbi:MAG: hypothetical protein AUJ12_02250 [Alphaproteobacteria bacterium CG1_02_46_17]|nr:MAG: hypothetical protein AUJ12_02250 [Alphaproteobacteria bacterium CG1_02_46_17]